MRATIFLALALVGCGDVCIGESKCNPHGSGWTETDWYPTYSTDGSTPSTHWTETTDYPTTSTTTDPSGLGLLMPPPAIGSESSWCWFVRRVDDQVGLYVVGMDSGTLYERGRYGSGFDRPLATSSLAYNGSDELVFDVDRRWVRIDLASETVMVGSSDIDEAVTALAGDYLVVSSAFSEVSVYPDFAALDADQPSQVLPSLSGQFSRYQVSGTTLFGAWHLADEFEMYDTTTGYRLARVSLEDYDTWVWGVGVAGGFVHLLDDGHWEDGPAGDVRVHRFDLAGNRVGEVPIGGSKAGGLWCDSR